MKMNFIHKSVWCPEKKEVRVKLNFIHKRYTRIPPPPVPQFTPVESMKIEIFEVDENILHFGM